MMRTVCSRFDSLITLLVALLVSTGAAQAQTPSFTYQGRLNDSSFPANGSYDLQFKLYDVLSGGTQIGTTATLEDVAVSAGIFTVTLDFGASAFPGANRWLEINVRPGMSTGAFTLLSPRQPVTSTPYAIRSLNATSADGLSTVCVGCVSGAQIGALPTDSGNYIQNRTTPQATADFNISGSGTAEGTLSANTINATTQYDLGGSRVLSAAGTRNLFAGVGAGQANSGTDNAFFGFNAGMANTTGLDNSYFGSFAGQANMTGTANSFFGVSAGFNNTGSANAFFGRSAGFQNTLGFDNSFFGTQAGRDNSLGTNNSFFGRAAGKGNEGSENSFFGAFAGQASTGVVFSSLASRNSFFGYSAGFNNGWGTGNAFFGWSAGLQNTLGDYNAFFGAMAGRANTTGRNNAFLGESAGLANTTGNDNSFFGQSAGKENATGHNNSFFGQSAGLKNTSGAGNSFFGHESGRDNLTGIGNSFFGNYAGRANAGHYNSFFGEDAGISNIGGFRNTAIGHRADVGVELQFATAIGADSFVTTSNTIVLGRNGADNVIASNRMQVRSIPLLQSTASVCFNAVGDLLQCGASSLRWKTNVHAFRGGLDIVRRLRPINFTWKENGVRDVGLGAEDVAQVAPSFVFTNGQGAPQGVKYERLNVLLINAVNEQQFQIEGQKVQIEEQRKHIKRQETRISEQHREIESIKKLVCLSHPNAGICK